MVGLPVKELNEFFSYSPNFYCTIRLDLGYPQRISMDDNDSNGKFLSKMVSF